MEKEDRRETKETRMEIEMEGRGQSEGKKGICEGNGV